MACEHADVVEFDSGVLESVVERALEAKQVALGKWTAEQLFAGDGQGAGVFRLRGSARLGDATHAWSVILKVLPEEGTAPLTAWSLPMREPLAYDSGLLETLPRALRAPRCLRYARQGGRHHLWLEDLGRDDSPWSLSDYAHAARQRGRFNGAYLEQRPVPAGEWLSRDWLRSWLAEAPPRSTSFRATAATRWCAACIRPICAPSWRTSGRAATSCSPPSTVYLRSSATTTRSGATSSCGHGDCSPSTGPSWESDRSALSSPRS